MISEFFELYLIDHGGESSVDHGIIGGGKAIKIKAFILVSHVDSVCSNGLVQYGSTEAIGWHGLIGGGGELVDITSGGGWNIVIYLHEESGH